MNVIDEARKEITNYKEIFRSRTLTGEDAERVANKLINLVNFLSQCDHSAWESTGTSRQCADCRAYL